MSQLSVVPVSVPRPRGALSEAPLSSRLRYLQPVQRELVHRSAIAEVFVTDGLRKDGDRFAIAAQWPRDHALYHPDHNGLSDPLLFAETIRQTLLYVSHAHFGIPQGHRFIGRDLHFEITDTDALRLGGAPLPVVLEVDWTWEEDRLPRRADARLDVTLVAGGRPCGRGGLRALVVDDRRYRLLRGLPAEGESAGVPAVSPGVVLVPPHRVGRLRWKDCVLQHCGLTGQWELRVDPTHAVLFDHPTDHVPLMAVLEGFRQLGHLTVHEALHEELGDHAFALTGLSVEFSAFAGLDAPVGLVVEDVTADPAGGGAHIRFAAFQRGELVCSAVTSWAGAGRRPHPVAPRAW